MSEVLFTLPQPPTDEEWCGVCAAFYKAAVIAALTDQIAEIEGDGKTGGVWVSAEGLKDLPHLQLPVMTGISLGAPVLGTSRLCWTHAPAFTKDARRLDVASGPLPPGLVRGKG